MKIENHKTLCCKSGWYRKGRADFRCNNCGRCVTMELVILSEAIEPKIKESSKKT